MRIHHFLNYGWICASHIFIFIYIYIYIYIYIKRKNHGCWRGISSSLENSLSFFSFILFFFSFFLLIFSTNYLSTLIVIMFVFNTIFSFSLPILHLPIILDYKYHQLTMSILYGYHFSSNFEKTNSGVHLPIFLCIFIYIFILRYIIFNTH